MTDLTGMDPKVMREVAEEIAGEIKQLAETFRAFERSRQVMRDTAISLLRLFARAAARSMTVAELDEAIGLARELQASGEFPDGSGPGDDVLPVLEQERSTR